MVVYMEVTRDEYELPIAIADNPEQLARICGTTSGSIRSSISHEKAGRNKSKYKRVEIEDD